MILLVTWLYQIPVVKKEFLAGVNEPFGKNADSVVAIDHHDFGVAVGVDGMVGEPNLVAFPSRVHHKVCGKEKRL